MEILRYNKELKSRLFDLLCDEGEEWSDYHGEAGRAKYVKALESSITYIACEDGLVCGYIRCRDDDGFGVYIYDLLVRKSHRGRQIGKSLIERVRADFPEDDIYVMSDVDAYYERIGFKRVGSVLQMQ